MSQAPSSELSKLIKVLSVEQLDDNLFKGRKARNGWQRVYGGQVLGQALTAAGLTVEPERSAHSLHGYFLLAGDPENEITYEVERIRDGGSFTTRRVRAIQHERSIFAMSASFHKAEPGYDHQAAMPDVPAPESLPSVKQLIESMIDKLPDNMKTFWEREHPMDIRQPDPSRYISRTKRKPEQAVWFKTNGSLPDDQAIHRAILAYASDFTLLDTALIAHGKLIFDPDIQLASLDHAMWFHRSFRADDWLLYVQDSPSAYGARGFCRGTIFDRKGTLIASTVQEGLMRPRDSSFVLK